MVATPRPGLKLKSLEALFSAPFSQAREDKLPVFEQNTRAHRALTANPVKSWVKWPPAPPFFALYLLKPWRRVARMVNRR